MIQVHKVLDLKKSALQNCIPSLEGGHDNMIVMVRTVCGN